MNPKWSGVFAIPVTPFLPDLGVDVESFRRQIRFCVDSGAAGIVYPAVVSEFFTLDPEERGLLLQVVLDEVAGAIPVIAGVSAPSSPYATKLAKDASARGAVGVMTMLPYVQHFFAPDTAYAIQHLRMVESAGLPLIFQNARIGYPLPVSQLPELVDAVPAIVAVKEETSPSTHRLGKAVDSLRDHDVEVFGGIGGIYLLDEIARGAAGTMPAPPLLDIIVDAFSKAKSGDLEGGRELLSVAGAAFTYELLYNVGFIKQIVVLRGVIDYAVCRVPAPTMDGTDVREMNHMLERLSPHLRLARPT